MTTSDEKTAFLERAVAEMATYILRYLSEVVGVQDRETGRFLGSGFFCSIDGRKIVATARHVIQEAESAQFLGVVFGRGDAMAPGITDGEILLLDEADLAFYVPDGVLPLTESKDYWPEDRIEVQPDAMRRDYLIVAGFPGRFGRAASLAGGAMASEALIYGAMMRYRECDVPAEARAEFDGELPEYEFLPDDLLEPHEFAIHFDAEPEMFLDLETAQPGDEMRVEDWLKTFQAGAAAPGQRSYGPLGLSGSPIFRLGSTSPGTAWSPDCSRLVGVATRWLPEHRVIVATSAKTMLEAFQTAMDGSRSADG